MLENTSLMILALNTTLQGNNTLEESIHVFDEVSADDAAEFEQMEAWVVVPELGTRSEYHWRILLTGHLGT